jgi:lipoprotein-anchoring transpeptidase ErfK/SrfK
LLASIGAAACARDSGTGARDAAPVARLVDAAPAVDPEVEEAEHRRALVALAHELYDAGKWDGAMLGATGFVTSVLSAPLWPEDADGGDEQTARVGYLRHGARVPVIPEPIVNDSCPDGWFELAGGGFVCGKNASLDPKNPGVRRAPHAPDLSKSLPYQYGVNLSNGTPVYRRVLSVEDRKKYEPWLVPAAPKPADAMDAGSPDDEENGTAPTPSATPAPSPPPAPTLTPSAAPSPSDSSLPWFLRDGGSKQVSLDELHGRGVLVRRMVRGFVVALDRDFKAAHAHWWRTTAGFAVPYERVVLHHPPPEFRGAWLDGRDANGADAGADASAPADVAAVAFVRTSSAHLLTIDPDKKKIAWGPAIEKRSALGLTADEYAANGATYRRTTRGDLWIATSDVTLAAPSAPPSDLAEGEKWIDVDLTKQALVAFEGTRPVFATLVSSGKRDANDKTKDHPTPTGIFRIQAKHVSATMDGDVAADAPYSIEDVPWVMYFDGSYALHGAFWHANFGHPMSHGCVNLSPADARTLFFWTAPRLPDAWHGVFSIKPEDGTRVIIHE